MKSFIKIVAFFSLCLLSSNLEAQRYYMPDGRQLYEYQLQPNGDTLYLANLDPLYCFPPLKFKNKAQEKFYWKTVRDVKKTLPYARIVSNTLIKANDEASKLPTDAERKKYFKKLEHDVKAKYESDIKKMTFSQGKMLIRLIDRETNITSYELIKMYRGQFIASFWQGIAKLFGTDLKQEYDGSDKDKIIERVIILVEAGQL